MSKLFCDCKTDEEKSNFFLSGRGVETGVIAPAISNEVAVAFHRCFEFEKQLASLKAELKAIGEAINDPRTDLTMTMSEVIVEQKQQLAAALAACKGEGCLYREDR